VVDVYQSVAVESGCDSSVECRSESVAGGQCSLNQRTLAERADPLNDVEKYLKTMALGIGGERCRTGNNGGKK
jgi:hypothetical protein